MALSGTINGKVTNLSSYFSFYVTWSATQSIEGNYSDVTVNEYIKTSSTGQTFDTVGARSHSISIDGTTSSVSKRINCNPWGNNPLLIHSYTKRVYHNDDGTKSIKISARSNGRASSWGYSASLNSSDDATVSETTITLDTIPRASSISSLSGSNLGSAVTVAISRASSSFTHKVEYSFAGSGWIIASSNADTSCSFIPAVSLASNIPTTDSGTLIVRVTTLNGSTQIGSPVTETLTLSLPSSYQPSCGGQISISNPSSISAWAIAVKGFTSLTVDIVGATASIGSTIASYSITGAGYSSASSRLSTGVVNSAGWYTFTVRVTDRRGRSYSATVQIQVHDYNVPSISVMAQRCNSDGTPNSSGTFLLVNCTYAFSQIGKNSVSLNITCNGVTSTSFESGKAFVLNANCAIGSSYILTASIKDTPSSIKTVSIPIPTASRIMNVKKNGMGIAFGGFADEDGIFKSYWLIKTEMLMDLAGNRIDINEIKAGLGFFISYSSGILTLGNYTEWKNAGKPSWPETV